MDISKDPIENNGEVQGQLKIYLSYASWYGMRKRLFRSGEEQVKQNRRVILGAVLPDMLPPILSQKQTYNWLTNYDTANQLNVEAILNLDPDVVLIDDLACINSDRSRHSYRYQDVLELLDAGIDVFATLNVIHIESVRDTVAEITGVEVDRTIPDSLIKRADQIEYVDILPETLIALYEKGQVDLIECIAYPDKYYRLGNLRALRELTLRSVAHFVDKQLLNYMQDRQISGPWAVSERILVCVSSHPNSDRLVRTGFRLATDLDAEWDVIYIDSPAQSLSTQHQDQLRQTLRLATDLGAAVATITAESITDGVLEFAHQNNITKIVIGQTLRTKWQSLLTESVVDHLIRRSGSIDVYVINHGSTKQSSGYFPITINTNVRDYLSAAFIISLATLGASAVDILLVHLDPANLVMFYLLGVVIIALGAGYGPAILAALMSVVIFNFFFVPPQLTFRVDDAQYLITFIGLLVAGLVIAQLTSRVQRQTKAASSREYATRQLYSLSKELAATVDPQVIFQKIIEHCQSTFECDVGVFLAETDGEFSAAFTDNFIFDEAEKEVMQWSYEHGSLSGNGTKNFTNAKAIYFPLRTQRHVLGVLSFAIDEFIPLEKLRLMNAFANQSAIAIEATKLGAEVQQANILREKEKLQNALLSSISHDLRTPLVSITGTLATLQDTSNALDEESRQDLVISAHQEAQRLNRLVRNLLDMSRLEAGSLKLKQELYDIQELIGVARTQIKERIAKRELVIELPQGLVMIEIDLVLMAQVIVNLLDNAAKYSEPDTQILIAAYQDKNDTIIEIADRGIGIQDDELDQIFSKFYRGQKVAGQGGTGLGLSICQGIVELHGGKISAKHRTGGGTCFIIQLPKTVTV